MEEELNEINYQLVELNKTLSELVQVIKEMTGKTTNDLGETRYVRVGGRISTIEVV